MPIVRRSQAEISRGRGRVDLKRVRSTTDKDVAKWIAEDPDTAPELPRGAQVRLTYNPPLPDVKGLRKKLGLTQADFAKHFGLSRRTIEQWEQGRAVPDRPARILLVVIESDPRAVERAVTGSRKH
ncbi:MAG: helix-turn-helix domain-containing protein [bacterium]